MSAKKLGIIGGGGHIGLIHAACLASLGYKVAAYDLDDRKIKNLQKALVPFYEPGLEELVKKGLEEERLRFTGNPEELSDAELVFICVGTPALPDGSADLRQVERAVEELARLAQGPVIAAIKSTVPVGTNRKLSQQLGKLGLSHKLTVIANPEFLAEGSGIDDFLKPSRIVVGGKDPQAMEKVVAVQSPSAAPVIKTSWENAELIKHASNALLATKISFINEVADICEAFKGDIRIVSQGIGLDPRIGPHFLEAGLGFSGPCLGKDLRSFISQFGAVGEDALLLEAVFYINLKQLYSFVQKLEEHLGGLRGQKLGVLGLAFKPGTDDVRDSHSLPIIRHLLSRGAVVAAHDPLVGKSPQKDWLSRRLPSLQWAASPYEAAERKDALLILTACPEYRELDLERLKNSMANPLIFDGRNLFDSREMKELGFEYIGIGI